MAVEFKNIAPFHHNNVDINNIFIRSNVHSGNITRIEEKVEDLNRITVVAGENISAKKAVVFNSSGKVIKADCSTLEHLNRVVGWTDTSVITDSEVDVIFDGKITNSTWGWNVELPLFLSEAGEITQVSPETGFVQIVAYPVTTNTIIPCFMQGVIL